MTRQQVGRWGEQVAASYLESKGYVILARNVRTQHGEIDLVTQLGATTVFVEVKSRTSLGFGLPEEAVTGIKREHLLKAVQAYWQSQTSEGEWRVDVIAILGRPGKQGVEIEHFENALTE